MAQMLRLDTILVAQQASGSNQLSFAFRGKRWGIYSSAIALVLLWITSVLHARNNLEFREYLVPGGYLFSCLFMWSAIYSYFTTKVLTFDGIKKVATFHTVNPFGTKDRIMDFSAFSEIRLWRPGRKSFIVVVLRMHDGQEIPLGTSEAGCLGHKKALDIARKLSEIISIPVMEESTVRA